MNHAQLRTRTLGRGGLLVAGALAALLAVPLPSSAATITGSWQAKIGSGGANGTASVVSYLTSTGSVTLKLAKLKPATLLPVAIYKGTCSAVGAKVVGLASIKTTSKGAATRTTTLTVAQATAITKASAAGKMTIRVGSGSAVKCGLFAVKPITPYVAATVPVGPSPSGVIISPNGVWVTNWWNNTLSRIDPATNAVIQTIPLAIAATGGPEAIAFGSGSLWVTVTDYDANGDPVSGSVLRVDPSSGQLIATIPTGKGAYDIEVSEGAVWVPLYDDGKVVRIDPTTNAVAATIPASDGPWGVAFGAGSLWVAAGTGKVSRVDPATNQVIATIQTQDTGAYVAVAQGAVWVTNGGHKGNADGTVTRIDPATNSVTGSVHVGERPQELVSAGGSLWVGLYGEPTLVQVNPATVTIVRKIALAHEIYALAGTDHAVWAVHNLPEPEGSSDMPNGIVTRVNF